MAQNGDPVRALAANALKARLGPTVAVDSVGYYS
jgi:hypothetical protein